MRVQVQVAQHRGGGERRDGGLVALSLIHISRLLPFSEGAGISPSLGFGTLPLLAALSVPLHPGLTRRQRIVLPLAVATLVAWTCLPAGFLAWHWGIVPNGSPWRQAFVLALSLIHI